MELKKIKLNKLAENSLTERQMKDVKGGDKCCICSCAYMHRGGSSTHDNMSANHKGGYSSKDPIFQVAIMKLILLCILLLCSSLRSYAQSPIGTIFPFDVRRYTTLDTASYRIDYKTTCTLAPQEGQTVTNDMYLLIGKKMSKFGHVSVLDNQKEIIKECEQKVGRGIDARGLAGIEVYKYTNNTPRAELTVRLFVISMMGTYTYKDQLHPQSWQLGPERKDILGYTCQRATTTFRGRKYTAWVATDIPLSNGPWLLGGLPGLILEAYDSNKEYHFVATSISRPQGGIPIVKYKDNYINSERRKVNDLYKRMHSNIVQTLKTYYPKGDYEFRRSTYPHNPIELE